jgi:hypothetical protein
MTVFQSDQLNNILQTIFVNNSPLRYLECSIYSCILSHCQEENPPVIPEMLIDISGGKIKITCTHNHCKLVLEKAKECFILKNLKFSWSISVDDEKFEKFKN